MDDHGILILSFDVSIGNAGTDCPHVRIDLAGLLLSLKHALTFSEHGHKEFLVREGGSRRTVCGQTEKGKYITLTLDSATE